jgi:HK97 family phage major capsid protein
MSVYNELSKTIEELSYAFETFKQVNDQRLKDLEEKKSVDSLDLEKLEKLHQTLDQAQMKMQTLKAASKRPMIENPEGGSCPQQMQHKKLFLDYLKNGYQEDLKKFEQKTLSHLRPEEGGFLLPESWVQDIIKNVQGNSVLRSISKVVSTSLSTSYDLIIDRSDENCIQWGDDISEEMQKSGSNTPKFDRVRFPLFPMCYRPRITPEMLHDTKIDLEQWLIGSASQNMAAAENKAFFHGDGKVQPYGVVTAVKDKLITAKEEDKFDDKKLEEYLLELPHRIDPTFLSQAHWVMSSSTLRKVRSIKGTNGYLLWQPSAVNQKTSLMGYDVVVSDLVEGGTKANSVPLLFGNFAEGFLIIDSQHMEILRDNYTVKPLVELYMRRKVGSGVRRAGALTALMCKN